MTDDQPRPEKVRFPFYIPTYILVILFGLPAVVGVVGRLIKSGAWFGDYSAIACAAQKVVLKQPLYDLNLFCPGMNATVYVYPPIIAQAWAAVTRHLGVTGAAGLYGGAYWNLAGFMLWVAFFSRRGPATLRERAPFLVTISGRTFFWGNVGLVVHGAITAAAILLVGQMWPLVGVIALSSMIKPIFLTYVVLFLYAALPYAQRLAFSVLTIALGLAPSLWFVATGGGAVTQLRTLLNHFVFIETPGVSFLGWMSVLGAPLQSIWVTLGYLIFAAALALAGFIIAESARLTRLDRVWLALTVASLLNPRLMLHDLIIVGPGLLVVASAAATLSVGIERIVRKVLIITCAIVAVLDLIGGSAGPLFGMFVFSSTILVIGGLFVKDLLLRHSSVRSVVDSWRLNLNQA